ncbi:MAG TPA: polysaccharide deacetylase family protein [Gemmatimonadaceae bacterium]|nr:polysaccharide deacetylase family protein [Gemmatimonadaceae bacterium]
MRAILTYHSIDSSGSVISTSEADFARHVRWLASGRVEVVSLDELLTVPSDRDAVAITFDDGFSNFATTAVPLLEAENLSATVFVVTEFVGGASTWTDSMRDDVPTLPLMEWSQLARLHEEGFSIGAHSRTHPHLTRISSGALSDEVHGSADRIETEIGVRPRVFCYPYGSVDEQVEREVTGGFELACTTDLRIIDDEVSPHRLPRLDMYYFREAGKLEAWGTPRFERYLRLRAGARRIRASVRNVMGQGGG